MDLLVLDAHECRYPSRDVRTHHATEIRTEAALRHALNVGAFEYDCSQTAEIVCVCAGLEWPGAMVNGYTGTMLDHLPHYANPAAANVGALVVFGPGHGDHVCQVRHPGRNPTLYSHGSDRSSHYISLSVERRYHRAPVTFLSIANLGG